MTFTNSNFKKSMKRKINKRVNNVLKQKLKPPQRIVSLANRRVKRRVTRLRKRLNNPIVGRNAISTNVRRPRAIGASKPLTQAGLAFLKCAFAPPDFATTQVQGIPDNFRGLSILKKHRFNSAQTFLPTLDYYFILAPIPGVAYLLATTLSGVALLPGAIWNAVYYSDFTSSFGTVSSQAADVFTSFRTVSNHFELVCTANAFTWSGSISTWRLPLKMIIQPKFATGVIEDYTITGLIGATSTSSNRYVGPFNMGVFTAAYNIAPDFEFTNIIENLQNVPTIPDTSDFGNVVSTISIPGFDNSFESTLIKVSGINANQTAILRTWACYEYTVNSTSTIYEYATNSPPLDETALKIYREVALSLPYGVPYSENAGFWARVLEIIRTISGVGIALPGPYGVVSGGVNAITTGISQLTT